MSLLYYSHEDCLAHEMQPGHPERPDRLRAVQQFLGASGLLSELDTRIAPEISNERLEQVHPAAYLQSLNELSPLEGLMPVDPDTMLCPDSLRAARLAAGAVVAATEEILAGNAKRAFCAVRPPGHHAEAGTAMGFCFYNSIALGARRALDERVNRTGRGAGFRRSPRQRHRRHFQGHTRGAGLLELPAPLLSPSLRRHSNAPISSIRRSPPETAAGFPADHRAGLAAGFRAASAAGDIHIGRVRCAPR